MSEIDNQGSRQTDASSPLPKPEINLKKLPVYPNFRDIALPGFDFNLSTSSEYAKRLLKSVGENGEFVMCVSFRDGAYDNMATLILPSVKLTGVLCRVKSVNEGLLSTSATITGEKIVQVSSWDLDPVQRLVVATYQERELASCASGLIYNFTSMIQATYQRLTAGLSFYPAFPDLEKLGLKPAQYPYYLATFFNLNVNDKQSIIESLSTPDQLKVVLNSLSRFNQDSRIEHEIDTAVGERMEKQQREYTLRTKMDIIRQKLKEFDGDDPDDKYREALEHKDKYPDYVYDMIKQQTDRLKTITPGSPEGQVTRDYLDLLIRLPWKVSSQDNEDLSQVKKILDEDHYGLVKQKERILEYLAVKGMTRALKAPILCLYGPPGVGKTSLAISVAKALGRKFQKIALGGINDESEIRGHRRTYIGSMPGRIISAIDRAGVNNPVILLDEIDKIDGVGYHGDPASALLEVLDPEQNKTFEDHYLDLPFDLSNVLFICTANDLSRVNPPLLDRLELIELNTYTPFEKINIAKKYLIKLEEQENGLKPDMIDFTDESLRFLIDGYTMEAGVRNLRRAISTIMRKFAVKHLENPAQNQHLTVTPEVIVQMLKQPIFHHTSAMRKDQVGLINGLAYTEAGGDVLKIEVNTYPGNGQLVLTGNLKDVIKEACRTALTYVRSLTNELGVDPKWFSKNDIHIHFPEGAVPKDGPSAGVATACAIISAVTGIPAKCDVAMTGEVDLRGNAMPIGGLREKTLAAAREKIRLVLVPKENHKDVEELPQEIRDLLQIKEVTCVKEVLPEVLTADPFSAASVKATADRTRVPAEDKKR